MLATLLRGHSTAHTALAVAVILPGDEVDSGSSEVDERDGESSTCHYEVDGIDGIMGFRPLGRRPSICTLDELGSIECGLGLYHGLKGSDGDRGRW